MVCLMLRYGPKKQLSSRCLPFKATAQLDGKSPIGRSRTKGKTHLGPCPQLTLKRSAASKWVGVFFSGTPCLISQLRETTFTHPFQTGSPKHRHSTRLPSCKVQAAVAEHGRIRVRHLGRIAGNRLRLTEKKPGLGLSGSWLGVLFKLVLTENQKKAITQLFWTAFGILDMGRSNRVLETKIFFGGLCVLFGPQTNPN